MGTILPAPGDQIYMAFTCPTCKNAEAARLICGPGQLLCDGCFTPTPSNNTGVLHNLQFSGKSWNVKKMTIADAMRIKTNKKRSDGTYKPDPRWR